MVFAEAVVNTIAYMIYRKTAIALASAGLLAPVFSSAQVAPPLHSQSTLQPVLVYASRFEEKPADALPQTSIVTSEDIQSSGAGNVSEILSKVVGLSTRINLDGSTNAAVDMRGYGDTADNNVVILLDGVRISENEQASARTSLIPVEIIDHIEVTHGGNSVLYGDGATGGTINIVTKKIIGNVTVVGGGVSSYAGYQSNVFHSRDLGSSQLSVFGKGLKSNGYRDGASTKERSAGLNWVANFDASSSIGFRLLSGQEKNTLPGPLPSVWLNSASTRSEVPGYRYGSDTNNSAITLFGSKKWNNVEFTLDMSRREKSNDSSWRYIANDVYTGYSSTLSPVAPIGNTYAFGASQIKGNTQQFNPRLKVSDFGLINNTLVMGVDRSLTGRNMNAVQSDSWSPDSLNTSNFQAHFKTQGFYFRDDWQINQKDRVTLGYRTQHYSQSNAGSSNWTSFGTASANEIQYTRKFSAGFTGYVKSSQNFRLPNVDDNSSLNYVGVNPVFLIPQESRDIDIGANYKAEKWRSEIKLFKSNIKNEIAYDPSVNGGYGGNVNYDPTRREGVTLRQLYQLTREWDVKLNLHYVKATFTQNQYAGNLVPNTSRNNGNVALGYQFDGAQKLTFTTRFAGDKYASGDFLNDQTKISGYVVHDLSYLFKQNNFSLIGSINNIFNKQYTDLGVYKPYTTGDGYYYIPPYNMTVYPNPGRNFSVMGRYNF